jgi:hypothetical protein
VGKQTLLLQSLACAHFALSRQGWHIGPPQSMSVSPWFCQVSVQEGAGHTLLLLQIRLKQSVFIWHPCPAGHGRQSGPPQSLPVSLLSLVLLVQWEGTHFPPEHVVPGIDGIPQGTGFVVSHSAQTSGVVLSGSAGLSQ